MISGSEKKPSTTGGENKKRIQNLYSGTVTGAELLDDVAAQGRHTFGPSLTIKKLHVVKCFATVEFVTKVSDSPRQTLCGNLELKFAFHVGTPTSRSMRWKIRTALRVKSILRTPLKTTSLVGAGKLVTLVLQTRHGV